MVAWAKAPDFADRPERRDQVRAQTVVDKQRYLEDGLTPVACHSCGVEVLVRKSSSHQRSMQWTESPAQRCPVFAKLAGPGKPDPCPALEKSIQYAIDEGILTVDE
ncbi:hypothetical protein NONO_c04990 [Nocardia nova SH22a]|uniref:Uncharacterized protein n=1 Tax=Nocardia nova SH22a TaxID=1415166 RepID=W5T7Y9_9NOCA|nr:hypothetical protein [Nocardia nova]AHH15312.1 hypothetical protein NONO_c04990 [Nocardia nova SH22a]